MNNIPKCPKCGEKMVLHGGYYDLEKYVGKTMSKLFGVKFIPLHWECESEKCMDYGDLFICNWGK